MSDLRPISDHQEVFLNDHEISVISELLSLAEDEKDEAASQYYFQDLASNHESERHQILSEQVVDNADFMPGFGPSHTKLLLVASKVLKSTDLRHPLYMMSTSL